jgi:hypothetical protein
MAIQPILLRPLHCLAIFLVLCLGPLCFGESVVVQVLNGRDGKPVPDVTLQLRFANATNTMVMNFRTDSNGEARFQLPQATPESLKVEVAFTSSGLHCPCRVLADAETVMRQGLTVARRARGSKLFAPIQPAPGHIVFVARPVGRLESILFGE